MIKGKQGESVGPGHTLDKGFLLTEPGLAIWWNGSDNGETRR